VVLVAENGLADWDLLAKGQELDGTALSKSEGTREGYVPWGFTKRGNVGEAWKRKKGRREEGYGEGEELA
jgi:hypothetical protein